MNGHARVLRLKLREEFSLARIQLGVPILRKLADIPTQLGEFSWGDKPLCHAQVIELTLRLHACVFQRVEPIAPVDEDDCAIRIRLSHLGAQKKKPRRVANQTPGEVRIGSRESATLLLVCTKLPTVKHKAMTACNFKDLRAP